MPKSYRSMPIFAIAPEFPLPARCSRCSMIASFCPCVQYCARQRKLLCHQMHCCPRHCCSLYRSCSHVKMLSVKRYKNTLFSFVPYICIPIVYLVEAQYFTRERVAALSRAGYNSYLAFSGIPLIILALLGIFLAFRGKRAKEPNWAFTTSMTIGVVIALLALIIIAITSAINGSEA
jgi:hypothetical protein